MYAARFINNRLDIKLNLTIIKGPIKLLGIYIGNDPNETHAQNFTSKVDSLLRQLHWWKARDLSLQGRVLIVKAIGLSKFQYIASLVHIPYHVIKTVNSAIYEFVWKGKTDKVKRDIFEQDFNLGGFKMANLDDIIKASSIMWIKKYLDETNRNWKGIFENFCKKKNLNLFLQSNFDVNEIPNNMPLYYRASIINWHDVSHAVSDEGLVSNVLWYNKNIKLGGKTVFSRNLMSLGLWTVSDLFDKVTKNIIPFHIWQHRGATELDRFTWLGIVDLVRQNKHKFWDNSVIASGIMLNRKFIGIENVTIKDIKTLLTNRKYKKLKESDFKFKIKASNLYPNLHSGIWENLFVSCHIVPLDNKTKELQYKILMRYVSTNVLLYKMKKSNSQSCTFCMLDAETIEHLFYNCHIIKNMWFQIFNDWNVVTGFCIRPSLRFCVLGEFGLNLRHNSKYMSLYTLTLLFKSYLMQCKYYDQDLSYTAFKRILANKIELMQRAHSNKVFEILDRIADI